MSAFSTWARPRRVYGPLVLFVAVVCAITIAVSGHSGVTSHTLTAAHRPASGKSVFVSHHPVKHHPSEQRGLRPERLTR
jgi:hypothetical protein